MARSDRRKRKGGRRRNYAPAPDQVGFRKYLPIGWVNWLGLVLFGCIFVALAVETVNALSDSRNSDLVAAGALTAVFAYMVYLFGATRLRE